MRIKMITYIVSLLILQCHKISAYQTSNLALNKPVTQISTHSDGTHQWSASHAVDGDKTCGDPPTWQHYSATKSDSSTGAWWRVDLQQEYNISRVVVYGKPKDTNNQISGFQLYLTEKPVKNPSSSSLVYTNTAYENGIFNISTSKIARYCMLFKPDAYRPLLICEVEVYGSVADRRIPDNDVIQSIKSSVVTSMSSVSTYSFPYGPTPWQSSNVIDNVFQGDPNSCKCCAGTRGSEPPWLQIDLGADYRIGLITIYGRTDGSSEEQYKNLHIFVSNTSMEGVNGSLVFHGNPNNGYFIYTLPFKPSISFRYLMIRRFYRSVMTICEVRITNSKCPYRTFGQNCSSECHCSYNSTCDHIDGTCNNGYCEAGWQGSSCSEVCDYRMFGQNCSSYCHCRDNTSCDVITGKCDVGVCEPGWQGSSCDTGCVRGRFGPNCTSICHCKDGVVCNHVTGICPTGCSPGWRGSHCQIGKNILRTMTESANTSMSTTAHNWTSDLAIDGNVGPDPDMCHCCSGTQNSQTSWWMVDMGKRFPVNQLTVYSRRNEKDYQQLAGFQLFFSNNTKTDSFKLIGNNTRKNSDTKHELTFPSIVTRYIRIQRPGVLTLCEVLVYEGECQVGNFGDECSQSCHCADDRPCDAITGHCQSPICKTGWIGLACNKQCPQDTFGDKCTEKCFCAKGTCTNNHGICHHGKCRSGYTGSHCNEVDIMKTQNQTDVHTSDEHSVAKIIGGAIGGSVAVLVVIVAISIIAFRFRKRDSNDSKHDYATPEITTAQTETEYDTLDNMNDNQGQINNSYENERVSAF